MALLFNQGPKGPHYGILGEFASPADLHRACERVRDAGFTRFTTHDFGSPFNAYYEVRP